MAEYIDSANDDSNLLHPEAQDHADLSEVEDRVESEVIEKFTVRSKRTKHGFFETELSGDLVVALDGYEESADDADSEFKDAFKRTLADVISHRIRHIHEHEDVTSESLSDYSYDRQEGFDPEWPRNWDWRLNKYDLRRPLYTIG